uniref:Beta-lactamase n=1 Tax=bacterium enrichment culture clone cep-05 TaxID=1548705 RepID=A0A089PVQ3_9BACT|nr:beta-lactamase class C [bacterium enrichment culture clone cep-05]
MIISSAPRTGLTAAALSLFLAAPAQAADANAPLRAIVDQAVRPVIAEYDLPGVAVAVTVDGKASFFNYGLASREYQTPVSENTLFELGSISKTFTATLASYAQVTGKLSLEDHPGKYMPELKGSAIDKASVLNLGTYTAGGLPLQFPDDVSDDGMLAYFKQWKADAAPGTQRRYSNPSLGLFGHVAALSMGSGFAEAMEGRILPGLGMKHTHVRVPAGAMGDYAWGYDEANRPGRVNPGPLAAETYGIRSSAADMIRYLQANIDPSRLEAPLRRAVEGTHVGYFKIDGMVQGLGWEQYPYPVALAQLEAGNSQKMIREANPASALTPPQTPPPATLFNKTGSTSRFGAYAAFVPAQKIGVVILANKNYPIAARVKAAHEILINLETRRAD